MARPVRPGKAATGHGAPAGPGTAVRVQDLMTRSLVIVEHRTTVGAAWTLMRTRKIHHVPVVDDDRRLVGIVTDHDLRQVILDRCVQGPPEEAGRALERLRVDEIMTWGVITVPPDMDILEAARIMRERKVAALPVTDEARIVGLLTATDVIQALLGGAGARRAART